MQYGLVVVWLLTFLLLALTALPLSALLFARLADRGAAFTFPLALAVLGLVGFLFGHVAFGWPALLAGLAVLGGASYVAGRHVDFDGEGDDGTEDTEDTEDTGGSGGDGRTDAEGTLARQGFAEAAVVFAAAFLFLVAIRAVDPAVHPIAGEKFLDFGLLKSLLRTGRLPPEDVWFAGEPVAYFYGGHMIASLLARLTVTKGAFAYNLALAGFYAAFVTAAWGLASNVAAARGGPRRLAGGLGAFFVGIAGNLATPGRVLLWALPDGLARIAVSWTGLPASALEWTPGQFHYWAASRVIPRIPSNPESRGIATEFPLFAWLNGDLHGHMMSPPFLLLLAGLLFSYWLTPEEDRWTRRLLVFGAVPLVAGLITVVNSWSFLTPIGLTALALTFAPSNPLTLLPDGVAAHLPAAARPDGGTAVGPGGHGEAGTEIGWLVREELVRSVTAAGLAIVVLGIATLWALPFWLGPAAGRSLALVTERSPLGGLLLVHGGFLLVFVPYLARQGSIAVEDTKSAVAVLGLAVLWSAAVWFAGFAALALFGPLLVIGWGLLRTRQTAGFETVLLIAGVGLVLLVEFVYVEEQAGPGRFNTVFKTYAQVWALWAPAAGVALGSLATRLQPASDVFDRAEAVAGGGTTSDGAIDAGGAGSFDDDGGTGQHRLVEPGTWRTAGMALAVVVVVTSSVYAGFAIPNHFERGGRAASLEDPTLDATAFVPVQHPGEAPAIRWIDGLQGQPNIVTAAPGGYFWQSSEGKGASAPASLTGVPTVLGWYHEIGYRGRKPFQKRRADVRTIYTGSANAQATLLRQYEVEYVYVGPAERARYGSITIDEVPGVVVQNRPGDVVIYRVDEAQLPE